MNLQDFESFFKENQKFLLNFIYSRTRDRHLSEDVVIEAFMKAYNHWERIKSMEFPRAYLIRIAINSMKNHLNKKKLMKWVHIDDHESDLKSDENIEDNLLIKKEYTEFQDLLLKLKKIERDVILLKDKDNLKFEEISELLNMNLSTIKSHYRRGRIKLVEMKEVSDEMHKVS